MAVHYSRRHHHHHRRRRVAGEGRRVVAHHFHDRQHASRGLQSDVWNRFVGSQATCSVVDQVGDATCGQEVFRAYSKRVPRTNCALQIKKCAPRISSGIYFLSTS